MILSRKNLGCSKPARATPAPARLRPVRATANDDIRASGAAVKVSAEAVRAAAFAAVVSGVLLLDAPNALATNELGASVFNNNCAACHQGGRNVVIAEKTLEKSALEKYLAGGFKLESILYQVQNGKGAMPAWDGVLDDDEIEAVAQYVYETAESNGWSG